MASAIKPRIGKWYQDPIEATYFEVVAFDQHTDFIEIQYLDGEIGEIDADVWYEMSPTPSQPPNNAAAAFELSTEDCLLIDETIIPESLINPINQIEAELFNGFDDY